MTNIYETTIIVKPDLANDQMKNLNTSIEQFFNDNEVSISYKEDLGCLLYTSPSTRDRNVSRIQTSA